MLPEDVNLYRAFDKFDPRCLVELKMMKMSQEIRAKPEWYEKVLKPEITEKWKTEAKARGLSQEAIEYVINEVKYFAILKDGPIEVGPVPATWQADGLIDDELSSQFKKLVADGLENIPEDQKDYHPCSGELVVDLVHPSLYCYVENTSLLVNEGTIDEQILPKPEEMPRKKARTKLGEAMPPTGQYRWMPAEVTCDKDGKITFNSYINNLHPIKHKDLYEVIGKILQKFIPMFNRSLIDVINWKDVIICPSDKPIYIPTFEVPKQSKKIIDLKGEKLQIIIKLSNFELTPDKSKYYGGAWHLEGVTEESIVATGIYYYEMENITESKLTFGSSLRDPPYQLFDERRIEDVYGFKDADEMVQILGSLTSQQGRCIVFPNVYQHCIEPFELADKTKPGSRKVLVFFLIDPTVKVISTHNVLPQQPGWEDVKPDAPTDKRLVTSLTEARKNRADLMHHRSFGPLREFYERKFAL